jgi:hypothetical protein
MRAHDDHPLRHLLPHPPTAFQEEADLAFQGHRAVANRDRLVVREVKQRILNHQMLPRPGVPAIRATPGVYHRSEELLVAGTVASVIAAATADVDVLPAIIPWHHTLEQGLQQDRRAPYLELGISLTQECEYHPKVRDLPVKERPVIRLRAVGPEAVSTTELLTCLLQTPDALHQAQQLLVQFNGLPGLVNVADAELVQINGIGPAQAARIKAWSTTTRLAILRLRRRT